MQKDLATLLSDIRACRICAHEIEPRPVLRTSASARLMIIGQAPGTRVHATGIPWNDPSGDRLRDWLQMDKNSFYDESKIAIMPMGFCFPGQDARGADKPPRPECAPEWHPKLWDHLPNIKLTLLIGQYAQARYLEGRRQRNMTETVRHWRDYAPDFMPLPHPSWRNNGWIRKNPWFKDDLLPDLQGRVAECFGETQHISGQGC